MDYNLPGSSVHGILQAKILEWVAMPFSKESSQPKDQTHISYVSCLGRRVMVQLVKNLPAMQQTRIQSLGQEDPSEKGMATHSTILAWRILWREEPGKLITVHGVSKSQT